MQQKLHEEGEAFASPSLVPVVKSKRWDACVQVYAAMESQAQVGFPTEDDTPMRVPIPVWKGFINQLVESLGFNKHKGYEVVSDLERMGCVEVVVRGKRTKPSEIIIIQPPTEEAFASSRDALWRDSHQVAKFTAEQASKLELIERLNYLENKLEVLVEEFNKHLAGHEK